MSLVQINSLTLLHSERPKLFAILACLSVIGFSTISKDKEAEFSNSVAPDEAAHIEPLHLDLHCLPSTR